MASKTNGVFYSGKHQGDDYIKNSEISGSRYVFPELHINDFLLFAGFDLYTFNSFLQNQDQQEKVLYNFYSMCESIYLKAVEFSSNKVREPDLFYNESISDCVVITFKFCNDINPLEAQSYYEIVKKGMDLIYQDRLIFLLFKVFLHREFEINIKFGIPRTYSLYENSRGYCNDYGGFVCYL